MATEPKWISIEQALYIHDQSINRHGGGDGVRDMGLLESAMTRPENMFAYGQTDLFELAAGYAIGVARNHPFVDGNKRTAYAVAGLFLRANGYRLQIAGVERQIRLFEDVAAGKILQDDLVTFYRNNTTELSG